MKIKFEYKDWVCFISKRNGMYRMESYQRKGDELIDRGAIGDITLDGLMKDFLNMCQEDSFEQEVRHSLGKYLTNVIYGRMREHKLDYGFSTASLPPMHICEICKQYVSSERADKECPGYPDEK